MGWSVLALATFLLPGVAAAALLRSRAPLELTLLCGYVAMHAVVLTLQVVGLPLTHVHALVGQLLVAAALGLAAWRTRSGWPRQWLPPGPRWGWAPVGLVLVALATRSSFQALNGLDVPFRWGYLAERMLEARSLDFYPPVTGADFVAYGFPDGIAPLVASAYWYVWGWAGVVDPRLATPLVCLQWLCACTLVWRLASLLGGEVAGAWAGALAGSCAFLVQVIDDGQEVGLTTVGLLAALHAVLAAPGDGGVETRAARAIGAGLAVAAGALAREYGAAFLLPVLLAARRAGLGRRDVALLLVTAAALAGPWYLRNAARTGHPLYDLPFGPLTPRSAAYGAFLHAQALELGWSSHPISKALEVLQSLLERAPLVLVAGLFGLARRSARPLVPAALLTAALWASSVQYTGGGLIYSTRVLAPTIALLAVAGALALAPLATVAHRLIGALIAAATAWSMAAALAAPASPRDLAPGDWPRHVTASQGRILPAEWLWRPVVPRVLPPGARILSTSPYLGPALIDAGYEVVPLWSPEVEFVFTERPSYAQAQRRLAARGIVAFHGRLPPDGPAFIEDVPFFAAASQVATPLADVPASGNRLVALSPGESPERSGRARHTPAVEPARR